MAKKNNSSEGLGFENKLWAAAENVFWVPKEARWGHLQANAKQPAIGQLIDVAMEAIELLDH